jgi:hypothetical protein
VDLSSMREIARGIGEYAALSLTQPGLKLPLSR